MHFIAGRLGLSLLAPVPELRGLTGAPQSTITVTVMPRYLCAEAARHFGEPSF
jgi:hypothetical protein